MKNRNEELKRKLKKAASISLCAVLAGGLAAGTYTGVNYLTGYEQSVQAASEDKVELLKSEKKSDDSQDDSKDESTAKGSLDVSDIVEAAMPSIVSITTKSVEEVQNYYGMFGQYGAYSPSQEQEVQGSGSGIIIGKNDSELLIATNYHVVEGAETLSVGFCDSTACEAKVKGYDSERDLAVVAVSLDDIDSDTMDAITIATIGNSDDLKVGAQVVAIGNALGYGQSVTTGIVSAKNRQLNSDDTVGDYDSDSNSATNLIQTDAAINPGNSGGALVNAQGELVGINAMLYSQTGSFTGYGFAIPTSIMKKVVEDLKQYGIVQRALLGISGTDVNKYIDSQKADDKDVDLGTVDGVYVAEVSEDGSAADAGLKQGDVIVSVNGKHVSKMSELQEMLTKFRPGDKVLIGYLRDKKEKSVNVTLRNSKGTTNVVKNNNMKILGADFVELSDDLKKTLNLSYGVQIKELRNGRMKDAGMTKGFIILKANNQNIKTVDDLNNAFKAASNSTEQTLWIWGKTPAGKSQSFAVTVGEE